MTPQEVLRKCFEDASKEFEKGSKEDALLYSLVLRFEVAMERMKKARLDQ